MINSAEVKLIRVPVTPPKGDAIQKFEALELPIVSLKDADGYEGIGYGYTIGKGGTTIAELLKKELVPTLIGADPKPIAHLNEKLHSLIHALTPGCIASTALAAIDIALWDLAAKRASLPLHILLGGAQEKVLLYNTDVGWLSRPLDEMVDLCEKAVKRDGFKALKLKVGKKEAEEDKERIAAVRNIVGPQTKIMIDANQKWTLPEAIKRAKMLEPYDISWLEEPLPVEEINSFVRLGEHSTIPRAGGESIYSIRQFFQYVKENAIDIVQPDIARIGGITNTLRICALSQAAGLPVSPHISPELSITVAAAVPNSIFVEYIPQMEPILEEPVKIIDGFAIPPDIPGHGIRFDLDALKEMEVDYEFISSGKRA